MSLSKTTYVVAGLILVIIFPCRASAASFDCTKAKSQQEKLICSTPSLSKADEIMAAKYTQARSAASKISSQEVLDLKADQSGWILQKIQHCTPDIPCLSKSYKDRIEFFDFYLEQAQSPIAIPGTYQNQARTYRNEYGELQVRLLNDDKVVFQLWASTIQRPGTAYETVNDGEITDEAVLKNATMKYDKKTETDEACKLQISFSATKAVVQQEGTCGFGLNVYADGIYFKTSGAVPSINIDRPLYPKSGPDAKVEGLEILEITIGADGNVQDVTVVQSLGPDFDQQATAAVKQWKYKPATKDGKPVSSKKDIVIKFPPGLPPSSH